MNSIQNHRKIAIIGTGISGLGAAYLLHPHHDIVVYEKNSYVGGHARTINVAAPDGNVPVDTGFIVFNKRNYPLLTALFAHLNVPIARSNMSFGASLDHGRIEYGTQRLRDMFAQRRNLLRPQFWRMLADVLTFYRRARRDVGQDLDITLGQYLQRLGTSAVFRDDFLLAMGGAVWSMSRAQMEAFPARVFLRFFDNHGLLSVNDQPQWYTVAGGSREYVSRLTAGFAERIRLNCGVQQVQRDADGVRVLDARGGVERFDDVVFACHADQALAMIDQPTDDERAVLGSLRYQSNRVCLHGDIGFMPRHRAAWASWVYLREGASSANQQTCLTYWMNNLQPLPTSAPLFVTLNPLRPPHLARVYDEHRFEHPLFDAAAVHAQTQLNRIQGKNRSHFCGAYQRYGFHEDGLLSAVNMAAGLGITPSWVRAAS